MLLAFLEAGWKKYGRLSTVVVEQGQWLSQNK